MDRILGLIEDIYEAGARPEHWQATLTHLADLTGSIDATMGGATAAHAPMLISARTDPDQVRSYADYYHARNQMQLAVYQQPVGRAVLDAMIVDKPQFQTSEFFNDWCRPQGFLHGGAVNLAAAGGWRATIMFSGDKAHDVEELRLLTAISPHLVRAFQLNQLLHETRALGLGAMAALEHIDRGALVVDRTGHVRAANAFAERILGLEDGLFLRDGQISCAIRSETVTLERALANCVRGVVEASGAALAVTRSAGRSPLVLLCVPFPATQWWPGFEQQSAIIFIADRDARLEQQTEKLRMRFGLTRAEAAMAWEIARSGGRQAAAANRGVSLSTARTQLTSIFDKTGVRRQAELVRLLLENLDEKG